ncbi:MAG: translation initiation factor IF-2 [Holosporales bacterium]|jgi:translation initiation factor IF-2|nr:translation initiation factor IF-2 [Holosporales bacterium]
MASKDDASETPKRKVLSLKIGAGPAVTRPSHGGKTVEVEIVKRKRSGLAVDLESDQGGSQQSQLKHVRAGRLTDSEFKTRVKALQDAIKDEELISTDDDDSVVQTDNVGSATDWEKPESVEHNLIEDPDITETGPRDVEPEPIVERPRRQEPKSRQQFVRGGETVTFRASEYMSQRRERPSTSPNQQRPGATSTSPYQRTPSGTSQYQRTSPGTHPFTPRTSDYQRTTTGSPRPPSESGVPQFQTSQEPQKGRGPYRGKGRDSDGASTPKKVNVVVKTKTQDKRGSSSKRVSRSYIDRALNHDAEVRDRSMASLKRARMKQKNAGKQQEAPKVIRDVNIPDTITIGELANRMAVRSGDVIKYLMSTGTIATINQIIDGDTAEVVCSEFGHVPKRVSDSDVESDIINIVDSPDAVLISRAPIVAVMGHVDHGKTTLLDSLRNTSVAQKEAGGITQHVAAYQVIHGDTGRCVTFIDTPGHAAFANIRARGAVVTDIIVLVVAADDGIKEQTIEVIRQAREQSVPLIVAINKIDKPDINIDRIKSELMVHEVVLEDFGGDVLSVNISAKHGTNLDGLIDAILLQSDVLELKANEDRKAVGVVLESRVDNGRGVVASVIVQTGTINTGDVFVAGTTFGKIRMIYDDKGKRVKSAGPSAPVEIVGIESAPEPGAVLSVVDSEQKAREIAEYRAAKVSTRNVQKVVKAIDQMLSDERANVLNVFVKADVSSSMEVIVAALEAIKHKDISAKIVDKRVGIVSESDVDFAKNTGAIIVAFGVGVSPTAKNFAKANDVRILHDNVIYHMISAVKTVMESMLAPIVEENYIGRAEVRKLFFISRLGTIAGCYVSDGLMKRSDSKIMVLRNGACIFEGKMRSMRHEKDEIKESRQSHECGILADGFNDFNEGDVIECYEIILRSQSLD